jgi:hypothetical protein
MTELSVDIDGDGPALPAPRDPAWRRMSLAVLALGLAFAVGAAVGYQAHGDRAPAPAQQDGRVGNATVGSTGRQCATQVGTLLWLGIELINRGPGAVTLRSVSFTLPLGGLEARAGLWGVCGQIEADAATVQRTLDEGASVWVSGAFDVEVDCPMPLPVQFRLAYSDSTGANREDNVGGFPDLGRVPYSGCDTATTGP